MKKKIFIEGVSCVHCVNYVTEALMQIGAKDVLVNLHKKLATAEINDNITDEVIKAAIEEAGYDVIQIEKG
ncbi:heavy-metal-associated domain-containing protein [Clostridium estertheticum]|uniref:heavy-metal-associated domain-containing protein n=1 Tax=Clostridium estertheticum TaxID=238834 RepID=UPI0013E98CDB|nr:heavy-metal-associated domain-containing protein [Clostridium estertheticum]MBZ9686857.1 heavy-metal-associated domain-containing protein [Clostridium estertheticum]